MRKYKINWQRILIAIMLILLALVLVGCVMEDETDKPDPNNKMSQRMTENPSGWEEGLKYHSRGKDTTIYGEPYFQYKFNRKTESYDTVWYQAESYRYWEHAQTAGGMREEIWYWDDKSSSWYSFNRSGYYYFFEWRARIRKLENYVEN